MFTINKKAHPGGVPVQTKNNWLAALPCENRLFYAWPLRRPLSWPLLVSFGIGRLTEFF